MANVYPFDFNKACDRLLLIEGGYSNDPTDPGGETNWGISKRSYPSIDIRNLTRDGAKAIYYRDFWSKIGADVLPFGIVFQLFDFAVNSGIDTTVRALQRAIGVADDGHWGPVSATALRNISESDLIMVVIAERLDFMRKLKNWPNAGKGWAGRIASDLRYGAADTIS
jgi:lysozyme family protein